MKSKLFKSALVSGMSVVVACAVCFGAACTPEEVQHQHTLSGWVSTEADGHYKTCTGDNCNDPAGTKYEEGAHDTNGANNSCSVCGYTPAPVTPSDPTVDTSTKLTGKVYVVGDSTVCDYERTGNLDDIYLPRYGYGTQLYNYLNCDSAQIVNLALSGRSSKSYLGEADYATLTTSITAGDYLIIGFGHNDEKSDDAARFTNPTKSYSDSSTEGGISFQYNLYENYVKMAKDKGATPILCTPIVRYDSKGQYTGSVVHNTSSGDYAAAIMKLASDTQTAVVDLTTITKTFYMEDNAAAIYYHSHDTYKDEKPNETPDGIDTTHINKFGAKKIAYELLKALPSDCGLKNHVKTNVSAPTKANDYEDAKKADYVKLPYSAFVPADNAAAKLTTTQTATPADWYGTAFGELGGNDTVKPFVHAYADGTFTVGTSQAKGKITASVDGFDAAFVQIDITKNFTASAHVKVKTIGMKTDDAGNATTTPLADNQSGFGMMLRDDIYISKRVTTLATNYVAAGILDYKAPKAIFKRESKALAAEANNITCAEGAEYDVSIVRLGQKVTLTVKTGTTTFTKEYLDVKFNAVDSDNMYLCLFAIRGIVAEFTNVQFEITGDALGA